MHITAKITFIHYFILLVILSSTFLFEIHGPSIDDHLFVKKLNVGRHQRSYKARFACRAFELFISSNTDAIYFSVEPEVTIDGDQEQHVAKGSNIRLICRYEAPPPVSKVQWIKDGTVIVGNASKMMNDSRVTIPSFNESQIQLSISAASLKDGGNYTCSVTNILNSTQYTALIIIAGMR